MTIPEAAFEHSEVDEYADLVPDTVLATFKTWGEVRAWVENDLQDSGPTFLDQAIEAVAFRAGMSCTWRIIPADTTTDDNPNLGRF